MEVCLQRPRRLPTLDKGRHFVPYTLEDTAHGRAYVRFIICDDNSFLASSGDRTVLIGFRIV